MRNKHEDQHAFNLPTIVSYTAVIRTLSSVIWAEKI